MLAYSYEIFLFPFQCHIKGKEDEILSDQIDLNGIKYNKLNPNWKRVKKGEKNDDYENCAFYNEQNYFYSFVHDALYDKGDKSDNIVRHYERQEPKDRLVIYRIECKDKTYELPIEYINLNLYSTGVGVLSIYVKNDRYPDFSDILKINQYGRRIYPPFYGDIQLRREIAHSLEIVGLNDEYLENFNNVKYSDFNKPSTLITSLITEVATNIDIKTVIDDRMYVVSWCRNKEIAKKICDLDENSPENAYAKDFEAWYKYVFVDQECPSCQNNKMFKEVLEQATYRRWQSWYSLYGVSRYSLVMLSNAEEDSKFLFDYMESIYTRMAELVLVQKASVLRFSHEVTSISILKDKKALTEKVNSLYKEYIRFVNQIYFREVTAQDQGIELYEKLTKNSDIAVQVEKLDKEIDELDNYIRLKEEEKKSKVMYVLSIITGALLPATLLTGFFGMNNKYNGAGETDNWVSMFSVQLIIILAAVLLGGLSLYYYVGKKTK